MTASISSTHASKLSASYTLSGLLLTGLLTVMGGAAIA